MGVGMARETGGVVLWRERAIRLLRLIEPESFACHRRAAGTRWENYTDDRWQQVDEREEGDEARGPQARASRQRRDRHTHTRSSACSHGLACETSKRKS